MMDIFKWAQQYLLRNAKIKGWIVKPIQGGYVVNSERRYYVCTQLERIDADVIITLNTQENLAWASKHLNELGGSRVVFVDPVSDTFWILNAYLLKTLGNTDRFVKEPEAFSSEVPLV